MLDAASAAADPDTIACEPGQVVIDGQCVVAPANGVTATQGGTDSVHAPDAAPAAGAGGTEGHGH